MRFCIVKSSIKSINSGLKCLKAYKILVNWKNAILMNLKMTQSKYIRWVQLTTYLIAFWGSRSYVQIFAMQEWTAHKVKLLFCWKISQNCIVHLHSFSNSSTATFAANEYHSLWPWTLQAAPLSHLRAPKKSQSHHNNS